MGNLCGKVNEEKVMFIVGDAGSELTLVSCYLVFNYDFFFFIFFFLDRKCYY